MAFKMSWGSFDCLLGYYPLLPKNKTNKNKQTFFTHSSLAQACLPNKGHAETPYFPVSALSLCLWHENPVTQAFLYFLFCRLKSLRLWRFSQPFQGFLRLKRMMMQPSRSALGEKRNAHKNGCLLCCTILTQVDRSRMTAQRERSFSAAALFKHK